jgi:predicted GNAT family acetyltransferase
MIIRYKKKFGGRIMEVRRVSSAHNEEVMEFITVEPEFNLFIIGDIENYGYEEDFQTLWGGYDDGELVGILLRYYESFIVYSYNEKILEKFAQIVSDKGVMVSGKKEILDNLKKYLPGDKIKKERNEYFTSMRSLNTDLNLNNNYKINRASVTDVDRLIQLMDQIEEFNGLSSNREAKVNEFENNNGRAYYVVDDDNNMIASAGATAENSQSAMVIGVATLPNHRKKGLASICVYELCKDLLDEGKIPCLFYDNPAAGSIYRRLGFEEIGKWDMIQLNN